jgi:DNA-nicking Smr family endonuclease
VDKKQKVSAKDRQSFQQAMEGVKPLKPSETAELKTSRPAPRRVNPPFVQNDLPTSQIALSGEPEAGDVDDESSHRKNGVQKRVLQRLKRGRFPVSDSIDLHSMDQVTAQRVLLEFIENARIIGCECIRVVHGKGLRSNGEPKLKLMTRQILRSHPRVLAFTACKVSDGGDGAVDVLLKLK